MATKATSGTANRFSQSKVKLTAKRMKNWFRHNLCCGQCHTEVESRLPDLRRSSLIESRLPDLRPSSPSLKDFRVVEATDSTACYETFKTGLKEANSEDLKRKIIRKFLESPSNWRTINPFEIARHSPIDLQLLFDEIQSIRKNGGEVYALDMTFNSEKANSECRKLLTELKQIEATGEGNTKTDMAIKSLEKMMEQLGQLEEKNFPYEETSCAMNSFCMIQYYSYLTIYKQNPSSSICSELKKIAEFANVDNPSEVQKGLLNLLSNEFHTLLEQNNIKNFLSSELTNQHIEKDIVNDPEKFALFTFRPLELVDLLTVNLIPFVPIGFLDCAAAYHDNTWFSCLQFPVHDCLHENHIKTYRTKKGKEKLLYIDELVRRGELEDIGNVIILFQLMHEPYCHSLSLITCVAFLAHLGEYSAFNGAEENVSPFLQKFIETMIDRFIEVLEREQMTTYKEHLPEERSYTREAMRQKLEHLSNLYFLVESEKNAKIALAKLSEHQTLKSSASAEEITKNNTLKQLLTEFNEVLSQYMPTADKTT